jgi:hypothetical protein
MILGDLLIATPVLLLVGGDPGAQVGYVVLQDQVLRQALLVLDILQQAQAIIL